MKLRITVAVLFSVLFISCLTLPAGASAPLGSPSMALVSRCRVSTAGGNLNVRNNAGDVIAKLPNGTPVRIVTDDGDRFLVSANVGRRTIRGWVASEFIACY